VVARRAVRDGHLPTLAAWLDDGSHTLTSWHTDWSSQTGASMCGILHGGNHDIVAYRWLEKEHDHVMTCSSARDAAEIERRHSDGCGLLAGDGASRGNLFTGDAPHASLTLSSAALLPRDVRRAGGGRAGGGYYAYFANPVNALRTLGVCLLEILRELWAAAAQRRADERPRVGRGGLYPLKRAATTVISRDIVTFSILEDMLDGRPVVYANFAGYDEVAHHSGIERFDALATLRSIDQQIGRLQRAGQLAPRRYHFVVLSDHGQTQGQAFAARFGESIEEVVDRLCRARPGGGDQRARQPRKAGGARGPLITLASGHMAMVSLPAHDGRVPLETIEREHPRLLPGLVAHPGVGFALVRSAEFGPVALGRSGTHRLATGEVLGEDPLADYGRHAADLIRRADAYPHCADIVLNSRYDPQTGNAPPFETHVGSHGGLGGPQTRGVLLYPRRLRPPGQIVGAEALHRVLRGWLTYLGHADPRGRYAQRLPRNATIPTTPANDSSTRPGSW
jgi:hypothetical protein